MAFFKKRKLSDGKWHAVAANLMKPATIDDVADELSARSTVSRADAYAVLVELGDVMGRLRADAGDDNGREGALHPRIQPGTTQSNHGAHDAVQVVGVD